MKLKLKVTLCSYDGERLFGEGPYQLLSGVQELGSLRASAQRMGMAYTKAFHMVKHVETTLGISLTQRTIGGRGGGGSTLTPECQELLTRYEAYRTACNQAAHALYEQYMGGFDPVRGTDLIPDPSGGME